MEQQAANIVANNMSQAEMDEDTNKKNLYKQSLLYQQAMKEKHKHNFGKMTKNEKNFNKMDLYAFRNKDSNMYSMVPGINNFNTVGTHAMNRTRPPLELATARSQEQMPQLYGNIEDHAIKDRMHHNSKPIDFSEHCTGGSEASW